MRSDAATASPLATPLQEKLNQTPHHRVLWVHGDWQRPFRSGSPSPDRASATRRLAKRPIDHLHCDLGERNRNPCTQQAHKQNETARYVRRRTRTVSRTQGRARCARPMACEAPKTRYPGRRIWLVIADQAKPRRCKSDLHCLIDRCKLETSCWCCASLTESSLFRSPRRLLGAPPVSMRKCGKERMRICRMSERIW
jgi:hypothetical protein